MNPHRRLVADRSPLHGLTRRRLPFIPVVAQSVAAIAPAGTSAVTPMFVIAAVGGGNAVLAFLLATVVVTAVAATIRPLAQRIASVGGLYSYVAQGVGPRAALTTAWSAVVGYGAVSVAGLLATGLYLAQIGARIGISDASPIIIAGVIVAAGTLLGVLLVRGIRISSLVTLLVEVVAAAIMVSIMVVITINAAHRGIDWGKAFSGESHGLSNTLGIGTVVAVSAFVGFESATTLSAEAHRPFRSIPFAVRWTPMVAAAIYLLAVITQSLAIQTAPASVVSSPSPLTGLLIYNGQSAAAVAMDAGVATSFFACSLASSSALVRVLFCLGRERMLPPAFGRTHRRFNTPAFAAVCSAALITMTALLYLAATGRADRGLETFLTLSSLGYMGSYLAACLAAPALLRRIGETTRRTTVIAAIASAMLLACLITAVTVDIDHTRSLMVIYLTSLLLAVVTIVVVGRYSPQRLSRVGVFDEPTRDEVLEMASPRL